MEKTDKVLILGSIALDTIETKYGKAENLLGGSATYATIASGLYGDAIPIGIVGHDFPQNGFEIFEKFSENIDDIEKKEGGTILLQAIVLKTCECDPLPRPDPAQEMH